MTPEELSKKIDQLEIDFNNHTHRDYDGSLGLSIKDTDVIFSDNTTGDVSTTAHGYAPKAPNDTKKFLRGDATWANPYSATFTAYENISANDPVRVAFGTVTYLNQTSTAFVDAPIYGAVGTNEKWGSKFTTGIHGASVNTVLAYIKKVGSPVDNTVITIQGDSGGSPDGTPLGTVSIASSTISTTVGAVTFTFSSPVALSASTTYWVVISRSGSRDTSNHIVLANDGASANTSNKVSSSSVWGNASNLSFVVERLDGTAGQVVKADSTTYDTSAFIGFATSAITAGNSGPIQMLGIVSGFSGLSPGNRYYLQDDSTLATTVGTYTKITGIAVSTTEILIQPNE